MSSPTIVEIYLRENYVGEFSLDRKDVDTSIWAKLKLATRSKNIECTVLGSSIRMSWSDALNLIRELGNKTLQNEINFRFKPIGEAQQKIADFASQIREVRSARKETRPTLPKEEIESSLIKAGFTKRRLKPFQIRDVAHLLTLQNGANFSVPGAGKTTVSFALHILSAIKNGKLLVVAPKAAIQAWRDVVIDCMDFTPDKLKQEQFVTLDGDEQTNASALNSGAKRFIITYDLLIRQQSIASNFMAKHPTHLILDESHRMKAGWLSLRGSFLLSIASLPVRRDILSGTPMPQGPADIQSQLDFLWPGHGLGLEITYGHSPREVLDGLFVRTTKTELGLPPVTRHYIDVEMSDAQLALYSIVRNELLRNYSQKFSKASSSEVVLKARRSVMRMLQLSSNPALALNAMMRDHYTIDSEIVDQILEKELSNKMIAVIAKVRQLAEKGEKSVVWTIFTDTIETLVLEMADINPVYIHGGVPSGLDTDSNTREGKIKRFHLDDECKVLIANPAAAGEGISLHKVCHNAIYLDRSYVSTHYLQSIDRIHRLGLPKNQETNIYIYRTKAPAQIGSIDLSVSRRLAEKVRNMQQLLDDPDLHKVAYDEEMADDPIDYDIEIEDVIDLIAELEGKSVTQINEES